MPRGRRATLGADKAYDTRDFVAELRARGITPHVAQHTTKRRSAIDGRTTRHVGYARSIHARRFIERVFGWGKTTGPWRKTHFRGRDRVGMGFLFGLAVYDRTDNDSTNAPILHINETMGYRRRHDGVQYLKVL